MFMRAIIRVALPTAFFLALAVSVGSGTSDPRAKPFEKDVPGLDRVLVLDGSGVHDVGQLLLHTANWGIFGSYPGSALPFSQYPSAEWPAGSGVQHLNIAGLWVGGVRGGPVGSESPHVSTAAYEMEFRPTDDPIDKIYETHEGAPGGNRVPSPNADDDGDGLVDEDWLDGRDNDGDGLVDEDFAAISRQMFSCWYTDDQPAAISQYPEHSPLPIIVRQESYQWTDPRFDDFVGIKFTITCTGSNGLSQVYLGFFMDGDIGLRGSGEYWEDDAAGSWRGIRCTELGPAPLSLGYMYDSDGDGGRATSYIGAWILGHHADPANPWGSELAERVGMTSFQIFSGAQPYENGGDPVNDFQRFELMSRKSFDANQTGSRDYRILLSAGPFSMSQGETVVFHVGIVCGDGLEGLLDNAAMSQRLFDGLWYNYDGDPMTGVDRRETPMPGPVSGGVIDACRPELSSPTSWPRGVTRWINADCERENELKQYCMLDEADSLLFRTGVAGRERHVHWIYEGAGVPASLDIRPGGCPNPFNMRAGDLAENGNDRKGGVLPAALLGSEGFNVRDVDLASVRLEGIAPLDIQPHFDDVSRPVTEGSPCACISEGPDGRLDLVLKFSNQEIARALGARGTPHAGDVLELTLTGALRDGSAFEAVDCVTIVGNSDGKPERNGRMPFLGTAAPNPFNPVTRISYYLPVEQDVRLAVYDATGRVVGVLVSGVQPAGEHVVEWNARGIASGIYFCRLSAGGFIVTKKIVLLR